MPDTFQQTAQTLKALRDKLSFSTYTAVFGRTVEERQRAVASATEITNRIEAVLGNAFEAATSVASLAASPLSSGGLLAVLHNFLEVVDNPAGLAMQSSPDLARA